MKIYLASSWRNADQPSLVVALRSEGYEVYDFRNPAPGNSGFRWSEIDPAWQKWTPNAYRQALTHPIAIDGFNRDMHALIDCDACVLLLPCGRSAHLELGYAVGFGKPTFVLLQDGCEPELMYRMCTALCTNFRELVDQLYLARARLQARGTEVAR